MQLLCFDFSSILVVLLEALQGSQKQQTRLSQSRV
jgi:hypothetical protein